MNEDSSDVPYTIVCQHSGITTAHITISAASVDQWAHTHQGVHGYRASPCERPPI